MKIPKRKLHLSDSLIRVTPSVFNQLNASVDPHDLYFSVCNGVGMIKKLTDGFDSVKMNKEGGKENVHVYVCTCACERERGVFRVRTNIRKKEKGLC